jgi:hypothetical protein
MVISQQLFGLEVISPLLLTKDESFNLYFQLDRGLPANLILVLTCPYEREDFPFPNSRIG